MKGLGPGKAGGAMNRSELAPAVQIRVGPGDGGLLPCHAGRGDKSHASGDGTRLDPRGDGWVTEGGQETEKSPGHRRWDFLQPPAAVVQGLGGMPGAISEAGTSMVLACKAMPRVTWKTRLQKVMASAPDDQHRARVEEKERQRWIGELMKLRGLPGLHRQGPRSGEAAGCQGGCGQAGIHSPPTCQVWQETSSLHGVHLRQQLALRSR